MRIDKLLAHTGYGTRKTVKQLLKKRAVQVDGNIVTKGDIHVNPDTESVTVKGEEVIYEAYVYLMLHKPAGVVSATFDNRDKTVIDLVPDSYAHYALFPVGRLDKDTEGLLILTNDGLLNHMLTSPKKNIVKTYYAEVDGYVSEKEVSLFQKGITLDDGYRAKPAELRVLKSGDVSKIELDITEGKFHQVKRMFEAVEMSVLYLKRLSMGGIHLDNGLEPGQIRSLSEAEQVYLERLKNT